MSNWKSYYMKQTIIIFLPLLLLFGACKKSGNDTTPTLVDGTYKGTYQRQGVPPGDISQVTLTFGGGKFSGQSQYPKYPALCHGRYTIKGDKINFVNDCVWTADFDWTHILSGEFTVTKKGDSLELARGYYGISFQLDIYKLARQ
jgi:hypothetical protein